MFWAQISDNFIGFAISMSRVIELTPSIFSIIGKAGVGFFRSYFLACGLSLNLVFQRVFKI